MSNESRQVTISEVAKAAGVSAQTVSRVINNRPEITPATRQHVQEVIGRLGYQPNAIARSLIQRRSHTLGVVTSGLEYYGPSHILVGLEQGANRAGLSILLTLIHQPETTEIGSIVNSLISRQVEGIIWASCFLLALSLADFTVHAWTDGPQALHYLDQEEPDVVVRPRRRVWP